jgi:hypothetical protein
VLWCCVRANSLSAASVVREQTRLFGWTGMYRGLGPTLARAAVVSAVRFSAYELALHAFERYTTIGH